MLGELALFPFLWMEWLVASLNEGSSLFIILFIWSLGHPLKFFLVIEFQSSHCSMHDSYWLFASSMQVSSISGSSGSSGSVLHESTSDWYSSWQSDLQSAIERRPNPRMINAKTKATIIHLFDMILAIRNDEPTNPAVAKISYSLRPTVSLNHLPIYHFIRL